MRCVELVAHGGPEALVDAERPAPIPGPGELRVRVRAAAFNPVDVVWRKGPGGPPLPAILGRDLAGTVDAVGEGVRTFRIGEPVFAYASSRASNGAYAEQLCLPAALVAKIPAGVDFTDAAAVPVAGLTAHHVVNLHARPRPSEVAFVAGASGGVGSFVIPLLQLAGARILATAGSDHSARHLEQEHGLFAEQILRHDALPPAQWPEWIRARAPSGPAICVDLVGGDLKRLCFEACAPLGRVVSIVEEPPDFTLNLWDEATSPLVTRSLGFHFVQLGARANHGPPESWARYGEELTWLGAELASGRLRKPRIEVVGALSAETVRLAHARLESRHTRGKLVMKVP